MRSREFHLLMETKLFLTGMAEELEKRHKDEWHLLLAADCRRKAKRLEEEVLTERVK